MSEVILDVKGKWDNSLEDDIKKFQAELRAMMIKALPNVRNDMKGALKRHIETDVYKYKNKEYPRRKDNPRFGTALNDLDADGQLRPIGDINMDATWAIVGFDYTPDGSHSGTTADLDVSSKYYDADNPQPLKPNPIHRDGLIRRIETGEGYDWKTGVGPRPFWQNFVDEMTNGTELEDSFVRWLSLQGAELIIEADGNIVREGQDGQY